ncbi:hypothetical protein TWF730_003189 [Orbilia blumenaviensis]|uniref:Secreted protein n=1 Tax=Orbilia blumenaviensis TaxID=1796055 RepID=A0AAV9U4M1_9PEZI
MSAISAVSAACSMRCRRREALLIAVVEGTCTSETCHGAFYHRSRCRIERGHYAKLNVVVLGGGDFVGPSKRKRKKKGEKKLFWLYMYIPQVAARFY